MIDGEGKSNPYWWRPGVGRDGSLHLAWCWRRAPDAATNRNVCYAVRRDGGRTWERSDRSKYRLSITDGQAEVVDLVPERRNLINQCSSHVDHEGRPYLVHFRDDANGVPQIFHVFRGRTGWRTHQVTELRRPFQPARGGTLRLPLSRPEVVVNRHGTVFAVYRDEETGNRVRLSWAPRPGYSEWRHRDLTGFEVGAWDPNCDTIAMRDFNQLEVWVQVCEQASHERNVPMEPQTAYVLAMNLAGISRTTK